MSAHNLTVPLLIGNSVPTQSRGSATIGIAPAYQFQRADGAVNWPVVVTYQTSDAEFVIEGLEDTDSNGEKVTWQMRVTFLDKRNQVVGGGAAVLFQIPDAAPTGIAYPDGVTAVDAVTNPEYGPTWAEQAKGWRDEAEGFRDEALAAKDAAESVGTIADAQIASRVADESSATTAELGARYASVTTLAEVAVMASPSPQNESSRPRFRRAPELDGSPVFDFSQVTVAGSITHANMVEFAAHADPNKRWWLFYSTDHSTLHNQSGMFAATAPSPFGPFTDRGLVFRDDTGGIQHETPWVWWDERLGKFVSTYSIRNAAESPVVPAAVGSQVTKWGYSTDLVNWTVGGIAADVLPTDPGDGHTGYLRRWVISGREYAYSLFGGTIRGQRTMWRRRPTNDVTFQRDVRTMSNGKEMIRLMPGKSIAITGTPTTDSAAASATNGPATADIGWAASHMDLFAFRGRPTALFRVGPRQSGGLVNDQTLVTGVLSTSMNALAEPPTELDTGADAAWEDSDANFDALGNVFTFQGRCFFMYRSGGHQGAFGIGEIY